MELDQKTGRPIGDHGTALQAINWALDYGCRGGHYETELFLKCWREGDLDEWPEFYSWLSQQPENGIEEQATVTPTPVSHVSGEPTINLPHRKGNLRTWGDRKVADPAEVARNALQLAEGRLALLIKAYPDDSETCDHPTATRYVLEQVRAAIAAAEGPKE